MQAVDETGVSSTTNALPRARRPGWGGLATRGRIPRHDVGSRRAGGWAGFAFVLPTAILLAAFNLFPILYTAFLSLYHYDLLSPPSFIGLRNFQAIFSDPQFWLSLRVTGEYLLLVGPLSWLIAFGLAVLLKQRVAGRKFFVSALFLPSMMPIVAMSVVWENLLQPTGPFNHLLGIHVPWLSDEHTALFGIALLGIWYSVGWFMVVFLAGLSSIPTNLYEAAEVDGASHLAALRTITLPLMKPVFGYVVVQTTINGLQVFTPMYLMTGGGPNNATTPISLYIYQEGLTDRNMGIAAAASVIGLICVGILAAVYVRTVTGGRART
jgi:ABC-type sugar transport system permease subunit